MKHHDLKSKLQKLSVTQKLKAAEIDPELKHQQKINYNHDNVKIGIFYI